MPHTKENSYKAKWLAALADKGIDPTLTSQKLTQSSEICTTVASTSLSQLRRIEGAVGEATNAAIALRTVLDEYRKVGPLTAAELAQDLDEKLSRLPIPVALRRIRDLLLVATERIALLGEAQAMLESEMARMIDTTSRLDAGLRDLHDRNLEVAIGNEPTPDERKAYLALPSGSTYDRFGATYASLDTDHFLLSSKQAKSGGSLEHKPGATGPRQHTSSPSTDNHTETKTPLSSNQRRVKNHRSRPPPDQDNDLFD